MTLQPQANSVQSFLDSYVQAFLAIDGTRIAGHYNAPCVTVRADGSVHCLLTAEVQHAFFQTVAETYDREECRRWQYSALDVNPIGAQSVFASLDWEMLREDGSVIRRWRQSYNLLKRDADWRILASTFHQD
jgi:ketosteroid isomerase-like protein